jgi:hypothetical protein
MSLERLRRVQWVLRAALVFALLISTAANVLHAEHDPIARGVAGWSPVALFVAIEVMMRVPIRSRVRAGIRICATILIAGIAAWTSYWHMVGVVGRYESGLVPYLMPVSVDGLIIVLSVSLFDVASQIRERLDITEASGSLFAAGVVPAAHSGPDVVTVPPTYLGPERSVTAWPDPPGPDTADPDEQPPPDDEEEDRRTGDPDPVDSNDQEQDGDGDGFDLAPDLVPLLPAARQARDELIREGRPVSRDSLANRLRRNGHPIRNDRLSALLAALKRESSPVNGHRPTTPV